jgi:flagellar biosynthesis protein FlhA
MTQGGLLRKFQSISQFKEIWLAALLCVVLTLIIIPLKPWMIDFFVAVNLLMSILIMVTAMYIKRILDFSVFPAMLLVTTLFRIAISIATARMILSNTAPFYHSVNGTEEAKVEYAKTAAGHVVKTFGELVAAGNAVIGIVMFLIIMVVQFVIVAQGAGRVSEVAARFTLDAMPGKQMAIDAEMNNRIITPEEAKQKRSDLERESAFFGAMDGAMKFVKGDAIAGMVIVVVNIIGGLIIGGVMGGMPFATAAKTFTILTIGQGLLEQIPSLLVAMAAGFLVTRGQTPNNLGAEIGGQLMQNTRSMGISAGILAFIGLAPGMPKIPIFALAILLGGSAWWMSRKAKQALIAESGEDLATDGGQQDEISQSMLRTDAIALEVGPELARLADPEIGGGELLERLKHVRRRIAMEFGVIAPGVRVRPHPSLQPGQYQIRIKGDLVAEGEVLITHQMGIGQDLDVPGIDVEHTTDPIYGTPAVWIPAQYASLGEQHGLQMFDAQDVVSTHVAEIVKQHLAELLTREEVAELLNMARQDAPMVVQELVPNMLALGQLRQVLQNLVKEQVPIKDLSTILNALADNAVYTKDPHALTEHVRAALGRKICARYQSPDGTLKAFMLSPDAERAIQNAIQLNETGQVLMLDPNTSQAIQNNLADALGRFRGQILDPVLITPPKIRRHVKALLERNFSKIVVLSYSEIVAGVQIDNLETIEPHAAAGV